VDIDEDFFGFRELGLDREFGMHSLNVPFHLLQNRMHSAYQNQNTQYVYSILPKSHILTNHSASTGEEILPQPPAFEPVTVDSIQQEIGIAQAFFINRLANNKNEPLVEDDELPPKQRFPKPRLPPSGKITSPRKRPIREQQQLAKKKRKLEEGREETLVNGVRTISGGNLSRNGPTVSKIRLDPTVPKEGGPVGDPEKDDEGTGMVSPPESM
jgi:transcriptional activator SPT7